MDLEQSLDEHLVPYQTPLYTKLHLLPVPSPLMSRDTKYTHARIQEFLRRGGGGGGSRFNCQKSALTMFFFIYLFFLVLNLFYRECPMVISKKTIIFQGFRGGPTFSRGGPAFSRGVQMLISIETHQTCDFPGGSCTPIPSLNPCMIYKLVFAPTEDLDQTASLQSDQCL